MKTNLWLALMAASTVALTGCNLEEKDDPNNKDGNDNDGVTDSTSRVQVDASSRTGWAYLDLSTGTEVTADGDWDLAFQRLAVRVNPDKNASAMLVEQADFYDADNKPVANVFLNATANSELEHLLASHDLSAASFDVETLDAAIGRDGIEFYDYDFMTHQVSANDDAWWVVRSAEGDSFAKLNPTQAGYDSDTHTLSLTADFFVQSSDASAYSETAVTWTTDVADGEASCFDFDAGAEADCATSSSWDLKLAVDGRSFRLLANSGISGAAQAGVYGALTTAEAEQETDGSALSGYVFNSDEGRNAISENDWYAYNLSGQHGIWPNYRVYGIQNTETEAVTLIQLISYYDESDTSGHITVRYQAVGS